MESRNQCLQKSVLKPNYKYDPYNVPEDYIIPKRSRPVRIQIKGRWFETDYENPISPSDLMPGQVILMESLLSSSGPSGLIPLVFLGGWKTGGIKLLGHNIPTFRYKVLGSSKFMIGIFAMKNIYVEVWP